MSPKGIHILHFKDAQQITINDLIQLTIKDDGEILIDFGGAVVVTQEAEGERMTVRRHPGLTETAVDVSDEALVVTRQLGTE